MRIHTTFNMFYFLCGKMVLPIEIWASSSGAGGVSANFPLPQFKRMGVEGSMDNQDVLRSKEFYREKIVKMVGGMDTQKGEILYRITSIIEILPIRECQRTLDYLSELYIS